MLRSDLCGFSSAYLNVKDIIIVRTERTRAIDGYHKNLILKNYAPFTSCIPKVNNIHIDNAEDCITNGCCNTNV